MKKETYHEAQRLDADIIEISSAIDKLKNEKSDLVRDSFGIYNSEENKLMKSVIERHLKKRLGILTKAFDKLK